YLVQTGSETLGFSGPSSASAAHHVRFLIAAALFWGFADFLLHRFAETDQDRCEYGACFFFADLPMILGILGVLFFWGMNQDSGRDRSWGMFLFGALTFQITASNVILALIEARVVQHLIWERTLDRVYPRDVHPSIWGSLSKLVVEPDEPKEQPHA